MIYKAIKRVKKELKKLFSSLFSEKSSTKYVQPIIDAATCTGYVEGVSDKADSLHLDINRLYEEDLQASFLSLMSKLAPRFRKGKVRFAVDIQEQGFYGKTNNFHIIGTSYKGKSYPKAFKFITISLLIGKKEERIPLYALPWHIGQDLVDSVDTLLSVVKPWFGKIEVVELDRGFYKKELVYWLNEHKIPYLIHIPKRGKWLNELVEKTKSFYRGSYDKKFNVNKSCYWMKTNLFVCKGIEKKDWLFVSSIWFRDKWQVRNLYRNRWQIETNYSVHNSARIKSKSTSYLTRHFYYLADILLQVLWRLSGYCSTAFKTFLFCMVVGVESMLEKKPHFAVT